MPAVNPYNPISDDPTQPARHAVAITPADGTDLVTVTRGIYVGTGGDLTVVMAGGETVTFTAVVAGVLYPLAVARVKATGTTATNMIGVY